MKIATLKTILCIILMATLAHASNGGSHRRPARCYANLDSEGPNTIDVFIGALLPQNVREYYADLQNKIKDSGVIMKNTLPNKLHVTIKFVGKINNDKKAETVEAIKKALEGVKIKQLTFKPKGLRILGGSLLAAILDSEQLKDLWRRLDEKLETICNRDRREYLAHISLGILERNQKNVLDTLKTLHNDDNQLTIDDVYLLGNTRNGPQQYTDPNDYEILYTFPK